MRIIATVLIALVASGCARHIGPLVAPRASAVALSGRPGTSMAYLARTDSGVVLVDLGWWGSSVRDALRELDATPAEVTRVFLTHSHRDHVGAWRLVKGARFHVAEGERARLVGTERHEGWVPNVAERLRPSDLPRNGEVAVGTFSRDTAFVLGRDTLRAYVVPGHTAGSAIYLFRGVLFLGDAVTYTPWGGFAPARIIYSDDRRESRASLERLWQRLPAGAVHYVCTAHAHCTAFSPAFLKDVRR